MAKKKVKNEIPCVIRDRDPDRKKITLDKIIGICCYMLLLVIVFFIGRATIPEYTGEVTLILEGNCNYFNVINFLEGGYLQQDYQTYSRGDWQNCTITRNCQDSNCPIFEVIENV